jgi:hypothetical protein
MIYGKSRNISISFTIISQKRRICKSFQRKSETKKQSKIVEIVQVLWLVGADAYIGPQYARKIKAAPTGSCFVCHQT